MFWGSAEHLKEGDAAFRRGARSTSQGEIFVRLTPKLHRMVSVIFLLYLVVLLRLILFRSLFDLRAMNISLHSISFRIEHLANFTPFKSIAYYMSGEVSPVQAEGSRAPGQRG